MRISYATLISADIGALGDFYVQALDLPERVEQRTAIYRAIDVGGVTLAISATEVYELLSIQAWAPASGTKGYLTFGVDTDEAVDSYSQRAAGLGGRILKEGYVTSYGSYQAVLADPEANVFRLNHAR